MPARIRAGDDYSTPTTDTEDVIGGCTTTPGSSAWLLGLVLLALVMRRRR